MHVKNRRGYKNRHTHRHNTIFNNLPISRNTKKYLNIITILCLLCINTIFNTQYNFRFLNSGISVFQIPNGTTNVLILQWCVSIVCVSVIAFLTVKTKNASIFHLNIFSMKTVNLINTYYFLLSSVHGIIFKLLCLLFSHFKKYEYYGFFFNFQSNIFDQ